MNKHVLSIDAGTTGITCLLVDENGDIVRKAYSEFPQHFPQPGWVEHDPEEIWATTCEVAGRALEGLPRGQLAAIGITNQRETTVVWDRRSMQPLHNAIVWQCRRSAPICDELRANGAEQQIRERTGLVLDAYFSGTKLTWLMRNVEGLRKRALDGEIAFGTIDSFLIARLTGGRVHATDLSNASRTMLFNINTLQWDDFLLETLAVPKEILPTVNPSSWSFGTTDPDAFLGLQVPISGVAGDQQSALFGQACTSVGMSKNTYGTGSFVLTNTGGSASISKSGLLISVAWGIAGRVDYAIEGAIFVTGAAVQWLRDGLGIISSSSDIGPLAGSVTSTEGVHFVPALTGLGAPYWDPYARGSITGITRGTTKAHIARAAVEAMAFQTKDIVDAMAADSAVALTELRVDGGASVMDLLCQFQADLLGVPVARPRIAETTAMGAAYLALLNEGIWHDEDELSANWKLDRLFEPKMSDDERSALHGAWGKAVERSLGQPRRE
ncbi:MAG: glycerol kinase GlpK [Actinomycetota bacterium]|nr:glycerol kinase GlpK [Actinomycetota bacterium]